MKHFILTAVIFLITASFSFAQSAGGDAVCGEWYTTIKDAKIQISNTNGKYSGKIVWLKEPNDKNGKAKIDDKNPDEKLRSRQVIGLAMLKNFYYSGDNVWKGGEIYDPKSGKTYSCKMTLDESGKKLEVRGFIGISLIGRTEHWTRVD